MRQSWRCAKVVLALTCSMHFGAGLSADAQPSAAEGLMRDIEGANAIAWICPHCDDEIMVPGVVAVATLRYKKPVYVIAASATASPQGMPPGATQESREKDNLESKAFLGLKDYVRFSRADSRSMSFDRFLAGFIVDKGIDLVITFDPVQGFNGHPQHIEMSKQVTELLRKLRDNKGRTIGLYYSINVNLYLIRDKKDIPHEQQPHTDAINMDTEKVILLDGTEATLREVRRRLLELYGDSVRGLNALLRDVWRHVELYRKVEL